MTDGPAEAACVMMECPLPTIKVVWKGSLFSPRFSNPSWGAVAHDFRCTVLSSTGQSQSQYHQNLSDGTTYFLAVDIFVQRFDQPFDLSGSSGPPVNLLLVNPVRLHVTDALVNKHRDQAEKKSIFFNYSCGTVTIY